MTDQGTPLVELKDIFMFFPVGDEEHMQAGYNVSLQLRSRDMIAVVGESGCGKSTVGRICLGVQEPTRGQVLYQGSDIWDPAFRWTEDLRFSVQIVHQDSFASLNPVRTIYQTLSAPLFHYGLASNRDEARKKVTELLQSVDLAPMEFFIDKYPFQLSGGQRQRVSIARTTILKPKLIVADEPVSAVDASMRLSLLDLMKKLNQEHDIAFLYITHDLATARYFAPKGQLVVMYLGRIVEIGTIDDAVRNPGHPYLQALLTAIPPSDPHQAKKQVKLPLKSFDMPNASNPPPGCVFHPRCPHSDEMCANEIPLLEETKRYPNRKIACRFKDKIPAWKK
ncbi:MAG: ATP-binding cassette domain-containing protein [bacterium]|nr:ATP-binding cassette domain-containing protein [bacterium]